MTFAWWGKKKRTLGHIMKLKRKGKIKYETCLFCDKRVTWTDYLMICRKHGDVYHNQLNWFVRRFFPQFVIKKMILKRTGDESRIITGIPVIDKELSKGVSVEEFVKVQPSPPTSHPMIFTSWKWLKKKGWKGNKHE